MADFGNIAGIVKSFTEPLDSSGNPKRFVLWAKEVTSGSAAVDILRYDFIRSKWVPVTQQGSVIKATIAVKTNLAALTSISVLDGIALQDGNKVLLVGQTDKKQNGIYTFNSGTSSLVRPISFSAEVPGDHLVYILNGSSINTIYVSQNIANVDYYTIGTDNINYTQITGSAGGSTSTPRNWILITTTDTDATLTNYITRLVTIFNALTTFSVTANQEIIIKHTYQTPVIETGGSRVLRLAYFKLNQPTGQTQFGAGSTPITINELVPLTPEWIAEKLFHPDQISLNGMGAYDTGNTQSNTLAGDNETQHSYNKKVALALKKVFSGQRISKFGQLDVKKIQANTDDTIIEPGDRVTMSNLNNDIFLNFGEYVSGDPLELASYDPNTSDYFDPNQ